MRQNKKHFIKKKFTHDLDKYGDIEVKQICSKDNLVNLFSKTLPTTMF